MSFCILQNSWTVLGYLTQWCWLAFSKYFGLENVCVWHRKFSFCLALQARICSCESKFWLKFFLWTTERKNEGRKVMQKNESVQSVLSKGAGIFTWDSFHARFGYLCFSVFFQNWHTSATHGDGRVAFRVGMTAPDTRAGTAQYDGRHKHWSAAEAVIFLPVRSCQASLTQTVRLREIPRVPRWIMGDSWINNNEKSYFLADKKANILQDKNQILCDWNRIGSSSEPNHFHDRNKIDSPLNDSYESVDQNACESGLTVIKLIWFTEPHVYYFMCFFSRFSCNTIYIQLKILSNYLPNELLTIFYFLYFYS